MIISRSNDERFSGIEWELQQQSLCRIKNSVFDKLEFRIQMFSDKDWDRLKDDWESHGAYVGDAIGKAKHQELRDSLQYVMDEIFWFDITNAMATP